LAKLKFNGETYTVDYAVKGADFIHGYDSDGTKIISYDGISDFSDFGYDQSYLEPEECFQEIGNIVRHHEGALKRSDGNTLSAADFGAAEATHTHTPADIGAASADHTHTPESIGAASLDIDGKVKSAQTCATIQEVSAAAYTLTAADAGKFLMTRNADAASQAYTITVPDDTANTVFPVGTEVEIMRYSPGAVTVAAGSVTTLIYTDCTLSAGNSIAIADQYGIVTIKKVTGDLWLVKGEIQ
jgi:hypothetical protein